MKIDALIDKYGIEGLATHANFEELKSALFEYNYDSVGLKVAHEWNGIARAAWRLRDAQHIFNAIIDKVFYKHMIITGHYDGYFDEMVSIGEGSRMSTLYAVAINQNSDGFDKVFKKIQQDAVLKFLQYKNESDSFGVHVLIKRHANCVVNVFRSIENKTIRKTLPWGYVHEDAITDLLSYTDQNDESTLHLMARNLDASQLKLVFEMRKIAFIDALKQKNSHIENPLHILFKRPELHEFNIYLIQQIKIDAAKELIGPCDKLSVTPIHVALVYQPESIINALIQSSRDFFALCANVSLLPQEDSRTGWHLAALYQSEQMFLKLIKDFGTDILKTWPKQTKVDKGFATTLFHLIAKYKGLNCLREILLTLLNLKEANAVELEIPILMQHRNAKEKYLQISTLENYKYTAIESEQVSVHKSKDIIQSLMATIQSQQGIQDIFVINNQTGDTLVHTAICHNSVALLLELFKRKTDFNQANVRGVTPWQFAISQPQINLNLLFILLAGNADPNKRNSNGDSVLDIAIENNWSLEVIEVLLKMGVNDKELVQTAFVYLLEDNRTKNDRENHNSKSQAIISLRKINHHCALLLLANGANVNSKSTAKETILHHALNSQWPDEAMLKLLAYKPDINLKNALGYTPMSMLLSLNLKQNNLPGFLSISRFFSDQSNVPSLPISNNVILEFIKCGAHPNDRNRIGQSIVHLAVITQNHQLLADLLALNLGVDFKAEDKIGKTPWDYLNPRLPFTIILQLLKCDAAPAHKRLAYNGLTPLHQLVLEINQKPDDVLDKVKQIVATGVNIEITNANNETTLAMLLNRGYQSAKKPNFNIDFAIKLLEAGATLETSDKNGNTLFHLLAAYDKEQYDKLVVKFPHAKLNVPNHAGNSALQILLNPSMINEKSEKKAKHTIAS